MNLILVLLSGLTAIACSANSGNAKTPPPRVAEYDAGTDQDAPQAPLLVRWQLISDEGGRLRISSVIAHRAVLGVPVDVQIEVPDGLQLISGETSFQLEANVPPGEAVNTLEFTYASTPPGDLKLVANVSGPGMGVHAVDVYRFGRAPPTQPRPQPSGPGNKIGNVDLGQPIQIDKK